MTGLPDNWIHVTLNEVASINPRHARRVDDSIPVTFVPMAALSEDSWNFKRREERPLGEVRKGYTHFAEGDVLLAKITPCLENGKAAIATDLKNGLGCGTTELHVLRSKGAVLPKYLYHFVHQEAFRREASANFTGTAGQLRVPVAFIKETQIPLPPLKEQRRIVEKVDRLLAKVESAKARLEHVPAILKRFRQAVLAAAVSGELTRDWRERNGEIDLPLEWKRCTLRDICELITKGASPKWQGINYARSGVLFITSENVGQGKLLLDNKKYVESKFNQKQKRSILRAGDILTNIVGASIGRSALYDLSENANINQAVALIRLKPDVESAFILMSLNAPKILQEMQEQKVDVARANLSLKDVGDFTINLPAIEEQKEIVRRVEALFKIAEQAEARYQKAKAHVDKLSQSILAKAFRGELVPQDPNDEPAEVLLERIKVEKLQ